MSPPASLARLAPGATTGVGSLPFSDPLEAVAHVRAAYDVPFCPQLPAIEGDMLGEWLGADPRRCGFSPDRQRPRPAAWEPFIASLEANPPAHGLLKLQVTGPLTLARGLGLDPDDRAFEEIAFDLARWAAVTVGGWVAEVSALGLTAIVVADEPGLGALASPRLIEAWGPIRALAPIFGLHVCGAVPWPMLVTARPDLVSVDLTRPAVAKACRVLGPTLDQLGIAVVPGIVSVERPMDTDSRPPRPVAARLVSPACGTGKRDPGEERAIARRLRASRPELDELRAAVEPG